MVGSLVPCWHTQAAVAPARNRYAAEERIINATSDAPTKLRNQLRKGDVPKAVEGIQCLDYVNGV